ncbi:myb/SANT-like DNA-binding domain-containing protein 4 [Penaeus japonicus]|uniref:myb/SANT-like DNA-binding domain-containing protein 4 n=1 Tax=Penaeus japonicus TaxID=27405 RepID=UPI001C712AA9|nr:myb/SANT-like DNA-binding domain-containing protein 4 [Penaeus japonicus]
MSKKRRPNFSSDEVLALIATVQQHQDILEGPLTATVSYETKVKTWEAVTAAVNATGKTLRSPEEVKLKYIDFKSNTKKKLSIRKKKLLTETGGGPPTAPPLTPAEEAMAQLIDPAVIYGITDALQSESYEALPDIATVIVEENEPLGPAPIGPETEEQSQPHESPCETPAHSRPGSRSSSTTHQAVGSRMLEIQEGILNEVRGMRSAVEDQTAVLRSALEGQTAALLSINESLLGLTNAIKKLTKP